MLRYKYIFANKIRGSIFINQLSETGYGLKLPKMVIAVKKNKFIVPFIVIFGTFAPCPGRACRNRAWK